jgi:hypothetical protein
MENKFKEGDFVYAIANPTRKMVVRRYFPRIYYCTVVEDPGKELVFFERELTSNM